MTANGEYMICPTRQFGIMQESEGKGPWICPMIRCRRELDINLHWGRDGCRLHGGKLPQPIEAEIINDLPYIDREQFEDIRLALATSHRSSRIPVKGYVKGKYEQDGGTSVRGTVHLARTRSSKRERTPKARATSPLTEERKKEMNEAWIRDWNPRTTPKWSFNSYGRSSSSSSW